MGAELVRQAAGSANAGRTDVATYLSHPERVAGCQAVRLDVRDEGAVARLFADYQPTVVIHTAADMTSPETLGPVIAGGTRHVAAAAQAAGARLVSMSTDVVFDGEHGPYGEADPPQPITPYGRAKAEAERIVAEICPSAAIVRTSLIYGLDPPDPRTTWIIDSLREGRAITLFGDEVRCPVWVEQLAGALLELAGSEQPGLAGVWHIAGRQALNRYEFGARLAHAYRLDPAGLTLGQSRASGLLRPRDCRLNIGRAQAALRSPLWGVDEVLAHLAPG